LPLSSKSRVNEGAAEGYRATHARVTDAELRAAEREQRRLGVELHDGLGQHLTGIAILAKALANELAARQAPEARNADHIVSLTNSAIASVRALARGLQPIAREDNALSVALAQLASDVYRVFGRECIYLADEVVPVANSVVAHHLFRIAQEAVHNAVKHGVPGRITIDLEIRRGQVAMTVTNPGSLHQRTGAASEDGRGAGIPGMRYRAHLIQARLSVENLRSQRVRVRAQVPLATAQLPRQDGDGP